MKRILDTMIVLVLLTVMTTTVSAATVVDSGYCGDDGNETSLTWELTSDGTLTIRGNGAMQNYSTSGFSFSILPPWYDYRLTIKRVIVEDGVTSIGWYAFSSCSELVEVSIPESVTLISSQSFARCGKLRKICELTGVTEIGNHAFYECKSLETVVLSNVVTIGSQAFEVCSLLRFVELSANLREIGLHAFVNCERLDTVYYTGTSEQWHTEVSHAFSGLDPINGIRYGESMPRDLTSSGVAGENINWSLSAGGTLTIGGAGAMPDYAEGSAPWYSKRASIVRVDLGEGVTSIGSNAFFGCTALNTFHFPGSAQEWYEIPVGTGNDSLRTIPTILYDDTSAGFTASGTCGESITWTLSTDGTLAITGSGAMKDWEYQEVRPWNDLAGTIRSITISCGVTEIGNHAFCAVGDGWADKYINVTIPDSVTNIGSGAFLSSVIKEIVLPRGLKSIGSTAFSDCRDLESITIPDTVTSIGYNALLHCSKCTVYYTGSEEQWDAIDITETEAFTLLKYADISYNASAPRMEETTGVFDDVPADAYYNSAVEWAVKNSITTGTGEYTFSPYAVCTRGQVVTFLWRAKGCPEPTSTNNPFTDVKTSDYFYKAVLWAVEQGITNGTTATTFSPNTECTNAHVVTFLWRANNEPAAGSGGWNSAYSGKSWYGDAVAWAGNRNLLDGSGLKFWVDAAAVRADIVTYLYKLMK